MVSIQRIGQVFTNNTNFSSQPNKDEKIINTDKAKIKSFANTQMNIGYATMGAGALAVAGQLLKNKAVRIISVIPATMVALGVGANMFIGGKSIGKAIEDPKSPTSDKASL